MQLARSVPAPLQLQRHGGNDQKTEDNALYEESAPV